MSKKAFTKRSFVKLFSRSEPDLHESPVKTKTDEKKRFKLPKLKIKSKGGPSSEKQLVFSPAELSNSPVDGPGRADNVLDKSSSSIYATARRSKAQELSNSETDLQKPNKFATFSFGLFKKKKKKKEDNLSRSTFGLHRSDIEEQQEKHADFKQMVDDQGSRKAMLSVSQPALDTSDNFDIPSPPSIHSKLLESYFALSQQTPVTHTAKPGPQEHLTNHSDLLLHHEGQNSPTANIPDLQQYDRVQSGEKETIPVGENQSESNPTSIHTSVWMTSASSAAETASQPNQLPLLDASEQIPDKVVDGNLAVTRIEDHDVFQQSDADILIRQPRSVPLSHVLDTRDRRSPNGEPSLTYDDANATLLPEPVPYTESAEAQQEVIFLHTEQSIPETAENTTKTLSISNQKIDPPVNQDVVYVALYESLFPRSFTSEILSSLPTSRADISPETRNVTKSEPLMVETPSYFQKETDVIYSRRTTSVTSRNDSFSAHNDLPSHQRFYSYNTLTSAEAQINSEIPGSYLPSSSHSSTYSYSEQPDESPYSVHVDGGNSLSLYEKALSSIPLASNSAPPLSDYVTSRGMDTQVTDSKQRVILVKEVVADGKNGDSGLSSSKPNEMTTDIGLKIKMDAADKEFGSFPPPGLTEPSPMPCSPVYLSVGSDDGSTMDIYFSAEEDNMDSLDEQTHIMDKIEESLVGPSEVTNFQRFSLKKEHFELLNTAIEGSKIANNELQERIYLQDDMQQLLRRRGEEFQGPVTGRTEFLKVEDGSIEEIDCVTKVLPKIKEEEFLVTPVLQVNTPLVCEFAAPSSNRQGEGTDETWINVNETARNLNEELLSHEIYYLQDGDAQSPKYLPQNNTRLEVEDLSTRDVREAEEKLLPIADPIGEESPEHADTKIKTTKCANTESFGVADAATRLLMDNAELQSDSTTIECNRHPQQTEWVDTIAENAGNGAQQEQVAVELPDLKADTHHPPNDATKELFWRQERLPEVQAALKQRSSTVASEAFNVNYPKTNADQESDDKMNPGYSSLRTALSMKNSPPDKLDESRYRFRKVSLVHPTDNATQQDAVDFSRMESNGMTLSTDHSWTHSFDGASRFMPKEEPLFSDSPSYRLYDTSSSTYSTSFLPEATSYSYNSQSELGSSPTDYTDASCFTGVFKATLVELDDLAAPASSPPASPDQFEMDNLKDTLKNMGPSLRPRSISLRGLAPAPVSALAPIVEDAPTPITADVVSLTKRMEASAAEAQNGVFTLPTDLGLKRNLTRDTRSPMELMKKKEQPGASDMPLRLSATSSILMRKSSDSSDEHKSLNGNGTQQSPTNSRLENSVIFGSYRPSTLDQRQENGKIHRSVFRSGSLPDLGSSNILKEVSEVNTTTDSTSRFERLSFLRNSSPSSSSFSTGADDLTTRKSLLPLQNITSSASSSSSSRLLSPTSSLENYRLFPTTESSFYSEFGQTVSQGTGTSTLSTPVLQRSFSHDSISAGTQQNLLINNNLLRGSHVQKTEPERIVKYRAFPDAYLTKEKEHGKLNPRPGKMYIFDRPGMCGQRIELRSDVVDATSWELQETISIRVLRGGWVLYEKRNFKGEKIALDEGDIELTCPFQKTEEEGEQQMNGQKVAEEQEGETNGETNEGQMKTKPARGFIIGSVRRAVRDYSVPEISLFPEENAEGKKVIFRDTSEDARIFGFPIKANSIIINAGLWLVFAKPFFEGVPRVLEVGGYSNPASWGVEQPYVGSLHPLKVGEPRVENISEPKIEIYERSYFTGKSRILTTNMKDFMTRVDRQQGAFMYSVGSLKVHGGIWVGYEKEGFRGNQYLLEEDEYHDWRVWGGSNSELRSVRVLQADLSEPLMVMFEQPEDEEGAPAQEENTFEVTEAIPDVELFDYKINTRSIQVFSGVWVAYSHVDFSGNQYILEKGFYRNCADWGSRDTRICSVQPVRLAPTDGNRTRNEILLYSEPEYKGKCLIFNYKQDAITEEFQTKSCRIVGGSWVLYENKDFTGTMYVLSEGRYSTLISMGCTPSTFIRSVKAVTLSFSVPSISLFGLEGLEGREITTDSELVSMVAEGFNDHILSVRVNSGYWVLCEFSHYRGRQFLLEPIEITNWPKFSSVQTVGSLYPVRQKRHFFRIRNTDSQHYMSIQGGVEEIKSGRVVVTPDVEPMSDIWFYQDGLIKNKLSPTMSLQVMGNIEPAAKLVLWSETRQPSQTWMAQMRGQLRSITFPGMVIDVKGGQSYDKEHVVIMPESDERLSQHWEIVMIN